MKTTRKFATQAVHAAEAPDPVTGSVAPTLVRSKTFAQTFGVDQTFQYSRGKNPTRYQLEQKLADLDGAAYATAFSSGVAATAAFLLTLNPGDHILCCQEIYGGTFRLLEQVFRKFGITADYVDFSNEASILAGIRPNTKWLFVETPTNPSLHIIDLQLVSAISQREKIPFIVDATFSPPCSTLPIKFGASVVLHSISKYIAGHNDVIGGALITNDAGLHEQFSFQQKASGAILSPDECYRALQGVKTLHLRWEQVSRSALYIAKALEHQLGTGNILYPGLKTHPSHSIAASQSSNGFGGVLSFRLDVSQVNHIKAFIDEVTSAGTIIYGESLASPETILAYPPSMSHKSLPREIRLSLGISDGFFRLSVGFEDPDDILEDLNRGFSLLRKHCTTNL